jgi:diaminopropionate ammonia-lyase
MNATTDTKPPIQWLSNPMADCPGRCECAAANIVSLDIARKVRRFHQQLEGYRMSPLKGLARLATWLGLGGIWVKDESARLSLNSFKVLGGSYAIYRWVCQKLGADIAVKSILAGEARRKLGDLVFAAATDGNHGRGVAWAATQLGFRSVIYVHKYTSQSRIEAIRKNGAEVVVVDGTYDDAVLQVSEDARRNGWQVISDTAWEGYEDIPKWVMQGYTTMLVEAQEQLAAQGIAAPTHVLVQAGVGALAASVFGFYHQLLSERRPRAVVVEPTDAACLYESARMGDGRPHRFPGELRTIMAGLACGEPSPLAWKVLRHCVDFFVVCPDYVAAKGMRVYGVPLASDPFVVSGESGAVTLGALMFIMQWDGARALREALQLGPESHVLLINTEGNTDPDDFRRVVWEGGDPVPEPYKAHRVTF